MRIVKWTPPRARRDNAWDRGEAKHDLASIIRHNFHPATNNHPVEENNDDDDDGDDCNYNAHHHDDDADDADDNDGQNDSGMDTRAVPKGAPVASWADNSDDEPLPGDQHFRATYGNAALPSSL